MAVQFQDVLALLPELFPGVQQIPYVAIHPNPDNPGAPLSDQDIQELADNLADRGLVNPLKVQPDPVNPLAGGVKPHTDNPRLTAEGRPWALGDFNWQILAGENRYRAAGRLGWATLVGFILNPTAEEAVEITHLDNDVRQRGWWAGYQSIEQLIKANPSLTQRQVATRLKMGLESVNRAVRLLPLLNAEARGLIVRNPNNSNKGIWGISESAVSRLADLGPQSTLKPGVKKAGDDSQKLWPYPAIPPETQDLVLQTLKTAIDEQMTESEVRELVGQAKESFQPGREGKSPVKPISRSSSSKLIDYSKVPVSRIRVNSLIAKRRLNPLYLQRRALAMQATNDSADIEIRPLSEMEKFADPDHDYELFEGADILKCGEMLGWSTLPAMIYDVSAEEGLKRHFVSLRTSFPLTWVDVYSSMQEMLAEDPSQNVAQLAVELMEDPVQAARLLPVMKLLNDNAKRLIVKSIHRCFQGRVDMGGYRFDERNGLELKRLEGISKNLLETQRLVERVIEVAVEDEDKLADFKGLVGWILEGNDPEEYFEKEA